MRGRALFVVGLCLVAASAGSVPVTGADDYEISIPGSIDIPDRNVTIEGSNYTISEVAQRNPGGRFVVNVTAPSGAAYSVNLRNEKKQIVDSRPLTGPARTVFNATNLGLDPGPYVIEVSVGGEIKKVQPVVIAGYNVTAAVPETTERGASVTIDASLTSQSNLSVARVEAVFATEDTERRVNMTGSNGEYSTSVTFDRAAEYSVYVAVRGTEEAYGQKIPIALTNRTHTIEITTPNDGGGSGGTGGSGGSGGSGGGAGGGAGDGPVTDIDVSRAADNRINATISRARANVQVTIPVPATRVTNATGVNLSRIGITPARDTNFSVGIAVNRSPPTGTPPVSERGEIRGLTYLTVTSDLNASGINSVAFRFSVEKRRLAALNRSSADVALYRYDGRWSTVATTLANETASRYVFTARSPGLSVFAVGLQEPAFAVTDAGIATASGTITAGETATITATVANTGNASGTVTVNLSADGTVIGTREVTLGPGEATQVTFEEVFEEPGEYVIAVNGRSAGTLAVEAIETTTVATTTTTTTTTTTATTATTTSAGTDSVITPNRTATTRVTTTGGQPGFGLIAALGAIGLIGWRRYRRRRS